MSSSKKIWVLSLLVCFLGLSRVSNAQGQVSPGAAAMPPGTKAASSAASPLPELSADDIAAKVQAFYDGARTFRADFRQRYTIFAYNKKEESRGSVAFVKPGRMSWRYTNNGNRVVSDGKTLKIYAAENHQLYEQNVAKSAYPAALSFLMGEGKLTASFSLKQMNAQTLKFKGGYVLLALPLEPTPAYQKMLLYVDGKTFQVRRVLMIDAQKNKNVFDFSKPQVNVKIPASEFKFKAPSGTQVIKP